MKKRVIIVGAAGRDYHDFLQYFKDNKNYNVVAFTQAQIPGIEKRKFPKKLAGRLYKKDIPFYPEEKLSELIKKLKVDDVVFAYSDIKHEDLMHLASIVLANGANFVLLGPNSTMIKSRKKVISICAVRTGSGKSQTSRAIAKILEDNGKRVASIRHPMPYGDLVKQKVQRFASAKDFKKNKTTIEEEEEYQPWIDKGFVIYAGIDYKEILKKAEKEADFILWDGGNNDFSFYFSDLNVVVADPHRAGHELLYHPGETNFRMADVIVINKIDSAKKEDIEKVKANAKKYNPKAKVILARSELVIDKPEMINGKRCLVVGDGPTLSHGGMKFGAGTLAVKKYNGIIVDPRKYAKGSIKATYNKYEHLEKELPAMGYGKKQIKELEETVNKVPCDIIVDGTPANLKRIIKVKKPIVEVDYELGKNAVDELKKILKNKKLIR
ncbi:GTPase [Candidatus Woesearchaeota archaeon]|nr:GTPase [Candidatus Woesearchaeota archaeon]